MEMSFTVRTFDFKQIDLLRIKERKNRKFKKGELVKKVRGKVIYQVVDTGVDCWGAVKLKAKSGKYAGCNYTSWIEELVGVNDELTEFQKLLYVVPKTKGA
jgi:hypothetical protein